MAEYKGIHGTKVQDYTTDPDNPITGQVWYNQTANTIRVESATTVGAWSTGGALNTARYGNGAAGVDNTAALVFGGRAPAPTATAITESYNGSSWTEVADLNTARAYLGGSGTQTSALGFGGEPTTVITELWNGSSWAEVNDMNTARVTLGSGSGTAPTSFAVGGWKNPGVAVEVESYNGTSWTEVADMNTARNGPMLSGDNTAAICSGGSVEPGVQTKAELWNGSSWTETGDINTARYNGGAAGTSTAALIFGGSNQAGTLDAETELWNGTSWSETTDLSTARYYMDGAGATNTNAICAGGLAGSSQAVTEEWLGAGAPVIRTITTD